MRFNRWCSLQLYSQGRTTSHQKSRNNVDNQSQTRLAEISHGAFWVSYTVLCLNACNVCVLQTPSKSNTAVLYRYKRVIWNFELGTGWDARVGKQLFAVFRFLVHFVCFIPRNDNKRTDGRDVSARVVRALRCIETFYKVRTPNERVAECYHYFLNRLELMRGLSEPNLRRIRIWRLFTYCKILWNIFQKQ